MVDDAAAHWCAVSEKRFGRHRNAVVRWLLSGLVWLHIARSAGCNWLLLTESRCGPAPNGGASPERRARARALQLCTRCRTAVWLALRLWLAGLHKR